MLGGAKLKLSIKHRVLLSGILPTEGDFRTMKTIMQLRNDLFLGEDEVKEVSFEQNGSQITWKKEKDTDISIGDLAKEVIVDALKNLDSQKKITADHVELWEMFLPDAGTAA